MVPDLSACLTHRGRLVKPPPPNIRRGGPWRGGRLDRVYEALATSCGAGDEIAAMNCWSPSRSAWVRLASPSTMAIARCAWACQFPGTSTALVAPQRVIATCSPASWTASRSLVRSSRACRPATCFNVMRGSYNIPSSGAITTPPRVSRSDALALRQPRGGAPGRGLQNPLRLRRAETGLKAPPARNGVQDSSVHATWRTDELSQGPNGTENRGWIDPLRAIRDPVVRVL